MEFDTNALLFGVNTTVTRNLHPVESNFFSN